MEKFSRTISLLGQKGFDNLQNSHVVLCGVGGVGSYALEALVRSGIGELTVIDSDTVSYSNINRQLIATVDTVGMDKIKVAYDRAKSINPDVTINTVKIFLNKENIAEIIPADADYIIDAIDFVPAKIALACFAHKNDIPLMCCLGTGNRVDSTRFEICDVFSTSGCPLARKMRYELKRAGVTSLDVLYSKADTVECNTAFEDGKRTVGSVAFVPSVAGLTIAQYVILKIAEVEI